MGIKLPTLEEISQTAKGVGKDLGSAVPESVNVGNLRDVMFLCGILSVWLLYFVIVPYSTNVMAKQGGHVYIKDPVILSAKRFVGEYNKVNNIQLSEVLGEGDFVNFSYAMSFWLRINPDSVYSSKDEPDAILRKNEKKLVRLQKSKLLLENKPASKRCATDSVTLTKINSEIAKLKSAIAKQKKAIQKANQSDSNATYSDSGSLMSIVSFSNMPNIYYDRKKNELLVTVQNVDKALLKSKQSAKRLMSNGNYIVCRIRNFKLQKWNHIVFNYVNSVADVFLDGVLQDSVQGVVPKVQPTALFVGQDSTDFVGQVCNFIYFNRAITMTNIHYLYNLVKNNDPPVSNDSLLGTTGGSDQLKKLEKSGGSIMSFNINMNHFDFILRNQKESAPGDIPLEDDGENSKYLSLLWYFRQNKDENNSIEPGYKNYYLPKSMPEVITPQEKREMELAKIMKTKKVGKETARTYLAQMKLDKEKKKQEFGRITGGRTLDEPPTSGDNDSDENGPKEVNVGLTDFMQSYFSSF